MFWSVKRRGDATETGRAQCFIYHIILKSLIKVKSTLHIRLVLIYRSDELDPAADLALGLPSIGLLPKLV